MTVKIDPKVEHVARGIFIHDHANVPVYADENWKHLLEKVSQVKSLYDRYHINIYERYLTLAQAALDAAKEWDDKHSTDVALRNFAEDFAAKQKPLGPESQKVLSENRWDLYQEEK